MVRRMLKGKLLSKVGLAVAGSLGMLLTVLAPPLPAAADTVHLDILWIYCGNQSEPFSDEIRLRVNGSFVGGWNDVDGGETHWYYSSILFYGTPLNIPFSGTTSIDILEQDSEYNLIGYLTIDESEVGTGEHSSWATMYDGQYLIHYNIY